MRNAMGEVGGRSAFNVRYQMIASLEYFLRADPKWTDEHLIAPLLRDDDRAVRLWNAVAIHPRSSATLELIGDKMTERARDERLSRSTRYALIRDLIFECLSALDEGCNPTVQHNRITQMIRSIDDEDRAFAADAVLRFVRSQHE
jgi:hypothetical protein